ncbi:patched domain-containing protein 3-like isoform X2 [Dendronephthya gigantea]|uniref:patched domain-containing protein 3-like isoform X2 n=1 Tax=Dendronephthya gigantea TaxID=151771 RepID=UPI00106CCE41|nr:patched domain-containing protein 3-like isoform X2 [Dendronephthya gigantea]
MPSESQKRCVSPWQLWLKLCRWYNHKMSQFFAALSEVIATHPLITIAIAVVFLGVFVSGVAFLKTENRTEKLYVPQNSKSIKNLKKAGDYGFYRPTRRAEIIIVQSGGNVLKEACFRDLRKLHRVVTAIPGYKEVCLPQLKTDPLASMSHCVREEPLWMFGNASNFSNIIPTLNKFLPTNKELFLRIFGKGSYDSSGRITSAQAMRIVYHMKGVDLDEEVTSETADWEKEFLKKMEDFDGTLECKSLVFTAARSLDDAINKSTGSDLKFITLTFVLMLTFACMMLGKYRNPLTGHGLLAMSGITCVGFGIAAGFGLSMLSQIPFVSIAGILPFLIVGVGIDDMFIIVDELDRAHPDQSIPKRLATVMRTVGPAITMTTMTDLVAFAIGTTSKFNAIVYFCTYAAVTITLAFLFLVTIFVAFMSYDCRRMNAGRRDMVPFLKAPPPRAGEPRWDEPLPQTSNKVMELWAKFLMKTPTKIFIVFLSMGLLAVGIYGTTFVNEEFDRRDLAKDGSMFIKYLDADEDYFMADIRVDLIIENVNYSDPSIQRKMNDLSQIVANNKFYRPNVTSWFAELQKWYNSQNTTLLGSLEMFLKNQSRFRKDIMFSEDNSTITVSRLYCFLKSTSSSVELRDAMTSLRDDLKDKSTLPVFANAYVFIFIEQFISTLPETIYNLSLASGAICVVTSLFLVNPLVILLVLLGFVSLIFELLGLMYIWGVSLNSISMINLVMAIGFAVDYSAHVAHYFVFSAEETPEDKAIHALKNAGASVIMGGFSTFLGMIVTAFASSAVFRIFFKMFFGIVVLGLIHGLCFLPVWLTIFCRRHVVVRPDSCVDSSPDGLPVTKSRSTIDTQDHDIVVENPALSNGLSDNVNSDKRKSPTGMSEGLPEDVDLDVIKNPAVSEDVNSDEVKQSSGSEDLKSSQESIKKNLIKERNSVTGHESGDNFQSDLSQDAKLNSTPRETKF